MDKIVYIILIFLIVYILKRDFFETNIENFESTQSLVSPDDANSINTLAQIARSLIIGNGAIVPGNLSITDKLTTRNLDVTGNFNLLPRGVVVAWNGTTVPPGWNLADGSNQTPDSLRNLDLGGLRYIMKL